MILAILSAISAIIAFLYSKEGGKERIGGVGYLLLVSIIGISILNIGNTYLNGIYSAESTRENEKLESENRLIQSYLVMSTLEMAMPLEGGIFTISSNSEDFFSGVDVDIEKRFVGMLPTPEVSGVFGSFVFEIEEEIEHEFTFSRLNDGSIKVIHEGSEWQGRADKEAFLRSSNGDVGNPVYCTSEDQGECEKELASKEFVLILEFLSSADGDTHLSIQILPEDHRFAAVTLSKLLQTRNLGYLRLDKSALEGTGLDASDYARLLQGATSSEVRFWQRPANTELSGECSNVIKVPIEFQFLTNSEDSRTQCVEGDVCIWFLNKGRLSVTPCQVSQI